MKLKLTNLIPLNLIPQPFLFRDRKQLIRRFGAARLVKLPTGEHELLGGTDADRRAAFEWASLFAHEIVFRHFHRGTAF